MLISQFLYPHTITLSDHLFPSLSLSLSLSLSPSEYAQKSLKVMIMDGNKGGGGGGGGGKGGKVVGHEEDVGDGMYCNDHPYRSNPGGICAFCLQEKLGKLVSSSIPLPIRASSSSSSSPSFRSDINGVSNTSLSVASSSSLSLSIRPTSAKSVRDTAGDCNYHGRARIPFLLAKRKKKVTASSSSLSDRTTEIVLKRSKSTTTTHRRGSFLDLPDVDSGFSPRRRNGFWSFLYLSSSKPQSSRKVEQSSGVSSMAASASSCSVGKQKDRFFPTLGTTGAIEEEEEDSPNSQATASASASSFERKVSRSRSVGCGSRSFSGDFFERISTGFGDCTLRRVESQREGKTRVPSSSAIKDRVKCGGIFGGFMLTSSSSSSSSSSYWVSSSGEDINGGKASALVHGGRNKSWGWAFASPMRAFSKSSSSKDGKKVVIHQDSSKNSTTTTPDLSAIPSLLAVRS